MKPFRLKNKDKTKTLIKIAEANGFNLDDLIAIYLVIGDDLFFLFKVLSGKSIKIPYHNRLTEIGNNEKILILPCEQDDYVEGELVEYKKVIYKVKKQPQKILTQYYCVLEVNDD